MISTHQTSVSGPYIPATDAMDRHEYGITKGRKPTTTGGGRAWSEDEEMYLLQTRRQKMPYKYIAAHLKKTELACRLHYHQLSHGSNRRKRAASCSSGTSNDATPTVPSAVPVSVPAVAPITSVPSPAREIVSRSASPLTVPGTGSYVSSPSSSCIQLPSIISADASPRLPAILPKPASMGLPPPPPPSVYAPISAPQPFHHRPAPFARGPSHTANPSTPPLRLDCSSVPPTSASFTSTTHTTTHVDLPRLHAIYAAHKTSFWTAIAHEYGPNVTPAALEQAWKTGICSTGSVSAPITPISSPGNGERERESYSRGQDKTRISSILGIDADPRTARDRDMVRRIEESRFGYSPMQM